MAEKQMPHSDCGWKYGPLPSCAPLAVSMVPVQEDAAKRYLPDKALARGTLFPGLDLPLAGIVNTGTADVPLAELMAIDFACHDLSLYLDTHKDDAEAFAVYKDLMKLAEEGQRKYARLYGPVCKTDLVYSDDYDWTKGPWPWDVCGKEAK